MDPTNQILDVARGDEDDGEPLDRRHITSAAFSSPAQDILADRS